jgi:hypothetical protein
MSTVVMSVIILALSGIVISYIRPRVEARLEKLFVTTLGALVGSLIGRVVSDPRWVGHLLYVASGAFVFAVFDWTYRKLRSAA